MNKTNFANWLKFITIFVGVLGLLVAFGLMPAMGFGIANNNPEFAHLYWPCLIFVWLLSAPCFIALIEFWKICCEIGRDRSFSMQNAKSLAVISKLALIVVVIWLLGVASLWIFWKAGHPSFLVMTLLIVVGGVGVSILTASLSHLTEKAANLKEENDLTV